MLHVVVLVYIKICQNLNIKQTQWLKTSEKLLEWL